MEYGEKDRCGYTVIEGGGLRGAMCDLDIWRKEAKENARTMRKVLALADALSLLWDGLDVKTRDALDSNTRIRELIRAAIEYYGFI